MAIAAALGIAGLLVFPGAMGYRLRTVRLKFAELVLFLAMAAIGIIGYGDKSSPTNNPPNGLNQPMMMMFNPQPSGPTVTETDVAMGFSVVSVGTNEVFDFAMPTDGVRVAKWWLRGGSNDKAFVPGGIAMIGGEILDRLPRPTARFCPLKATSLLVAGESEFWHRQTVSNSTVYTWKDAYLWRNLSLPFSMQAEIFGNGDFEYRYDLSRIFDASALTNIVIGAKFGTNVFGDITALLGGTNTVTSIYGHRFSEFDWDCDGLANGIDPDPYTNNGDCHGQGEGWVAACFTNAAEIAAAGGWNNWVATTVANDDDNWWYSFTVAASEFDACGHALIAMGDSVVVVTRESPSATFLLMRGRRYSFSVTPAGASFSSYSGNGAEPNVEYALGAGQVWLGPGMELLPPAATIHNIPGYDSAFFRVRKWNLHPSLDGDDFWSSERGWLHITDVPGGVYVTWDGPTNDVADTIYCDTVVDGFTNRLSAVVRYDPDPEPLPHVTLQSPDTVFVNDDDDGDARTNDFENASFNSSKIDDDIVPVVVGFKSVSYPTNGTLRLSAEGLRIWDNQRHVGTPVQEVTIPNCQTPFETTMFVERDSLMWSQVDACRLSVEWLERVDNTLGCITNRLTAAEPVAEPIIHLMEWHDNVRYVINPCVVAPKGRDALFRVSVSPNDYPADRISWTCSDPGIEFVGPSTGKTVRVRATSAATGGYFDIRFGDCPSLSPQIWFKACDLRTVVVSPVFVTQSDKPYASDDAVAFSNAVEVANDIFSQAGVQIVMNEPVVIELDKAFTPDYNDDASIERLYALTNGLEGITVFSVPDIRNASGFSSPNLWKLAFNRTPNICGEVLAHEIAHALGLRDIYSTINENESTRLRMPFRRVMAGSGDWSGGSGIQRFYERGRTLDEIVERCLMNGVTVGLSVDIPFDRLYGWTITNIVGNVKQYGFARVPIGESLFTFTTNSFNSITR